MTSSEAFYLLQYKTINPVIAQGKPGFITSKRRRCKIFYRDK